MGFVMIVLRFLAGSVATSGSGTMSPSIQHARNCALRTARESCEMDRREIIDKLMGRNEDETARSLRENVLDSWEERNTFLGRFSVRGRRPEMAATKTRSPPEYRFD
jgi:hypothetical protein